MSYDFRFSETEKYFRRKNIEHDTEIYAFLILFGGIGVIVGFAIMGIISILAFIYTIFYSTFISIYNVVKTIPLSFFIYPVLSALVIFAVYKIVKNRQFVKAHSHPLTTKDIQSLSKIRKIAYINNHFDFITGSLGQLKCKFIQKGKWIQIDEELTPILSLLAKKLSKEEKEWYIIVLADEHKAKWIWANRGTKTQCSFKGDFDDIYTLSQQYGCNTVLHIHNHPGENSELNQSNADKESDKNLTNLFQSHNLNFVSAITRKNDFKVYKTNFIESFKPECCLLSTIKKEHDMLVQSENWKKICSLYKEIHKGKNKKICIGIY